MSEVRRNRRRQECAECAVPVEPNAGYLTRSERAHDMGQWLVFHEQCAPGHLRAEAYRLGAKKLTKEGNILHPYDDAVIPKLRALPGAWWNGDQKWWVVSLEIHDRELLLQKADELGLEVDPELRDELDAYKQSKDSWAVRDRSDDAQARGVSLWASVIEGAMWLADREKGIANLPGDSERAAALALAETVQAIAVVGDVHHWKQMLAEVRPRLKVTVRDKGSDPWTWPQPGEVLLTTIGRLPQEFKPDVIGEDSEGKEIKAVNFSQVTRQLAADCLVVLDDIKLIQSYRTKQAQKFTGLVSQTRGPWILGEVPRDPRKLWDALCVAHMSRTAFGSFKTFKRCFNGVAGKWNHIEWGEPEEEALDRMERICFLRPQLR